MKAFTVDSVKVITGIWAWATPYLHVAVGGAEVNVDRGAIGEWVPPEDELSAYAGIVYDAGVRYEGGRPILCAPEASGPDDGAVLVLYLVGGHGPARLTGDVPDMLAYSHSVLACGSETVNALVVLRPGQKIVAETEDGRWREITTCRLVNGWPEATRSWRSTTIKGKKA